MIIDDKTYTKLVHYIADSIKVILALATGAVDYLIFLWVLRPVLVFFHNYLLMPDVALVLAIVYLIAMHFYGDLLLDIVSSPPLFISSLVIGFEKADYVFNEIKYKIKYPFGRRKTKVSFWPIIPIEIVGAVLAFVLL